MSGECCRPPSVLPNGAKVRLRWRDEFRVSHGEGFINGGIDTSIWSLHVGDGSDYWIPGWGNNELQGYTDDNINVRVVPKHEGSTDGMLVIQAQANPDPRKRCKNIRTPDTRRDYTSAKLSTNNKRSILWTGKAGASNPVMVTARIQVPMSDKSWPAFWMLPETEQAWSSGAGAYGGWCASGEIDILEHVNCESKVRSTIHYGGTEQVHWEGHQQTSAVHHFEDPKAASDWHTYTLLWDSTYIKTFVDDQPVLDVDSSTWWSATAKSNPYAPFDQPFHLILNMAVGGNWPGTDAPASGALPCQMLVDYVRVFDVVMTADDGPAEEGQSSRDRALAATMPTDSS